MFGPERGVKTFHRFEREPPDRDCSLRSKNTSRFPSSIGPDGPAATGTDCANAAASRRRLGSVRSERRAVGTENGRTTRLEEWFADGPRASDWPAGPSPRHPSRRENPRTRGTTTRVTCARVFVRRRRSCRYFFGPVFFRFSDRVRRVNTHIHRKQQQQPIPSHYCYRGRVFRYARPLLLDPSYSLPRRFILARNLTRNLCSYTRNTDNKYRNFFRFIERRFSRLLTANVNTSEPIEVT